MTLTFGSPPKGWPSFCVECGTKCTEPPLCSMCEAALLNFLTFDQEDRPSTDG